MQKPMLSTLFTLKTWGMRLHVAVTGGAGVGAQRLDVALMGEVRVPGEEVDPDPFDRLLLGPGLPELLDLGLAGCCRCRRSPGGSPCRSARGNARLGRDRHRVVAVLALDLELAGVDVVPEEDRLARALERAGVADDRRRRWSRRPAGPAAPAGSDSRTRGRPQVRRPPRRRARMPAFALSISRAEREPAVRDERCHCRETRATLPRFPSAEV